MRNFIHNGKPTGKDTTTAEPTTQKDKSNSKEAEKPTSEGEKVDEIGGPKGKEPTRFGDWEKNGRISDF